MQRERGPNSTERDKHITGDHLNSSDVKQGSRLAWFVVAWSKWSKMAAFEMTVVDVMDIPGLCGCLSHSIGVFFCFFSV